MAPDPYHTLGVSSSASDAEVRKAYRRLVQQYHPDHNDGSDEAERRFEEVQEAYAKIRELQAAGAAAGRAGRTGTPPPRQRTQTGPTRGQSTSTPPPRFDPGIEARAAALERELKEAHLARERAREAARRAAAEPAYHAGAEAAREGAADTTVRGQTDAARTGRQRPGGEAATTARQRPGRPSDEELGYIKTDDSFTKILADARAELSERFSEAQGHPVVQRVSDLIEELDALASKLTGDRRSRGRSQ